MKDVAKIQLRLPRDVRDWLEKRATDNHRSMNSQVIADMREKMIEESTKQNDSVANVLGGPATESCLTR
jgi:hypothetical protein